MPVLVNPLQRQAAQWGLVRLAALATLAVASLAGCAQGSLPFGGFVPPGMTGAEIIARHGAPTRIVPLTGAAGSPVGSRLQYSGQPLGPYAFMVDLDTSGRVISSRQVLQPTEFARIQTGIWSRADVEREFGPPASVDRVASWPGDILNYRWHEAGTTNMLLWVYLDASQTVQRVGQGMDLPIEVFAPD